MWEEGGLVNWAFIFSLAHARPAPHMAPPPGGAPAEAEVDAGWPSPATPAAEAAQAPPRQLAPPPPPAPPPAPAHYFFSPALARLSTRLPVNTDRPALVHALIAALPSFLDGQTAVARVASPASVADLAAFHDRAYLRLLAGGWAGADEAALAAAGLEDDCPPFEGLWEVATHTAGASLAAARALAAGVTRVAFALDGGRHHARPARAAGFCYVNDAVLACQVLAGGGAGGRPRRVLYLDVDAHHGDGVEAAFVGTPAVLTVSIHHAGPGFYPGSGGAAGAGGVGAGTGFALNLPLARGARDGTFLAAACALGAGAVAAFAPHALVLQLGADGLARDPVADAWSLTPAAYGRLAATVRGWCAGGDGYGAIPLLVLGGGGYDSVETAKAWACGVCGAAGIPPPADVPDHAHVGRYGPTWRLGGCAVAPTVRDENEAAAVVAGVEACLAGLRAGVERVRNEGACVRGGVG